MRVLVTGASGFIGSYLIPLLVRDGHEVTAVSSRPINSESGKVRWVRADLLDEHNCRALMDQSKPECLVHLAWYAVHGKFWSASENFQWIHASTNLLRLFFDNGGRRFIGAGTCAEYDWSYGYCSEAKTPAVPRTIYGKSKDALRQYTQIFCEQNQLEWFWTRIFFPYGIGEPEGRLIPSVIRAMHQAETVNCSHGQQYRDFLHVADAASALAHLITSSAQIGIFNIASGLPIKLADIIHLCARHFEHLPNIMFGSVHVPDDDPIMLVGSVEKLRASGWTPEISLEDGIARYIHDYRRLLRS